MTGPAVMILGKIMVDSETPKAVQARVAHYVLTHSARAIEVDDNGGPVRCARRRVSEKGRQVAMRRRTSNLRRIEALESGVAFRLDYVDIAGRQPE